MKKIIFAILALTSLSAIAYDEMAYTTNNAGGYMFFTYSYCVYKGTNNRVPNKFFMYSTDSNGQRVQEGCYEYKPPFYLIDWNSGGSTAVKISNTTIMSLNK